jgi:hypothetical protein
MYAPLIPVPDQVGDKLAGIQKQKDWMPACADMSGEVVAR